MFDPTRRVTILVTNAYATRQATQEGDIRACNPVVDATQAGSGQELTVRDTARSSNNKVEARMPPDVDLDQTMRGTWFGTKVRVEATIDASLYREIQKIIEREQKHAQERDWSEIPISNVVEMILRKGVRAYNAERSTD